MTIEHIRIRIVTPIDERDGPVRYYRETWDAVDHISEVEIEESELPADFAQWKRYTTNQTHDAFTTTMSECGD